MAATVPPGGAGEQAMKTGLRGQRASAARNSAATSPSRAEGPIDPDARMPRSWTAAAVAAVL